MNLSCPVDVLARTIWGEARGEGRDGMLAVANVVMNRVAKKSWWGRDVIGVCLFNYHGIYQFSCWNSNDGNLPKLKMVNDSDPQFLIAENIAENVLEGLATDPTHGATHYYDRRMKFPPHWSLNRQACALIGNHIFFKDIS